MRVVLFSLSGNSIGSSFFLGFDGLMGGSPRLARILLQLFTLIKNIVDCNGFQNDGKVGDQMKFQNLYKKWKGFGWHTIKCNGHDIAQIISSLHSRKKNKPTVLIAKTIKGKGISFMENENDWHHGRLTKKIYKAAIQEI